MAKRTDKCIKNFVTKVAKHNPNFVAAYLFGSYARKNETEDSDIDLALIIRHLSDTEKFDTQVQLMLLASQFDLRIEPHPMSLEDFNSANPFAAEIRRTGIEIQRHTPKNV